MSVWMQNFLRAIERREVIILHGNVRDRYIDPQNKDVYENLTNLIQVLSASKYQRIIFFDSVGKERIIENSSPSKTQEDDLSVLAPSPPSQIFAIWEREYLSSSEENTFAVVFYLDKLVSYKQTYGPDEGELILRLEKIIENITSNNRLIMVALSDTMVPVELYTNSPKTAVISIPIPDKEDRLAYLKHRLGDVEHIDLITDLTDGLYLRDLDIISRELKNKETLGRGQIKQIIDKYRIGEQEDHWSKLNIEKIDKAINWFVVKEGVKGQDDAVQKVIDTLTLARASLSGMSSGTPSKPKGILFFAGPTGVGKTFLAKKLAEFLFGSKEAFIRFDMSEFKEEHTISKFIGSPPGYTGYERGGLLTNAVRERPFSVILFDEIEKAHPKIMDMFLQILDEGRLTDSRGQTVFFTETVIIFTSNIGTRTTDSRGTPCAERDNIDQIREEKINDEEKRIKVHNHFRNSVEQYFMYEISRPELLNRIGNNIVPFNYIDNLNIQNDIIRSHLNRITDEFKDRFKSKKFVLQISDSVIEHISTKYGDQIAGFGGRSVTTAIEDEIMKPLSKEMLLAEHQKTTDITFSIVSKINSSTGQEQIVVKRK